MKSMLLLSFESLSFESLLQIVSLKLKYSFNNEAYNGKENSCFYFIQVQTHFA